MTNMLEIKLYEALSSQEAPAQLGFNPMLHDGCCLIDFAKAHKVEDYISIPGFIIALKSEFKGFSYTQSGDNFKFFIEGEHMFTLYNFSVIVKETDNELLYEEFKDEIRLYLN